MNKDKEWSVHSLSFKPEKHVKPYVPKKRHKKPITQEMLDYFIANRQYGVTLAARAVGSTESAMNMYCKKNGIRLEPIDRRKLNRR